MTDSTLREFSFCCGNGDVDTGEQCDKGDLIDGDGCSSHCLCEPENLIDGIYYAPSGSSNELEHVRVTSVVMEKWILEKNAMMVHPKK